MSRSKVCSFRSSAVAVAVMAVLALTGISEANDFNLYFGAKRDLTVEKPIGEYGVEWVNLESGLAFENGSFVGVEFGYGWNELSDKSKGTDVMHNRQSLSAGVNIGGKNELIGKIYYVYGISLGAWYHSSGYKDEHKTATITNIEDIGEGYLGFGGPFFGLNFYGLQLTNRMLIGREWGERKYKKNNSTFKHLNQVYLGYTYEMK